MKKKLIIGMGKSGYACGEKLVEQGYALLIYDKKSLELSREKLWTDLSSKGDVVYLDDRWTSEDLDLVEEAIISPGISNQIPLAQEIQNRKIPLIGEVELAVRYMKGTVIGITGTNGKTTTTTLVYEIFRNAGFTTHLAGNIGIPLMECADKTRAEDIVVVELSSFQLESIREFRVDLGMILNITPDHLDRHGSMEAYQEAKMNLFRNSRKEDFALLNLDDPLLRSLGETLSCKVLHFSTREKVSNGAYLEEGVLYLSKDGRSMELMQAQSLRIPGLHNVQNALAAAAATYFMGVDATVIGKTLSDFPGVEHRIEFVRKVRGVSYYNDSKGTNTDAGIIALKAIQTPVVLIAGGYDKKADYKEWISHFFGKVRKVFLIGETARSIKNKGLEMGFDAMEYCDSLEDAVHKSAQYAQEGDTVLLSPACASWDMFDNYEVRGRHFKMLVNELLQ